MTIDLEQLLSGSATVDWVDPSMTGTTKQVTEAIDLGSRARDVSWEPGWADLTGATGVFGVEVSNHAPADNVWTPGVLDTDFFAVGDAPAADDSQQRIHGALRARFARLTYTNATNTGTLQQGVRVVGKRGTRQRGGVVTPLTILGAANVPFWINGDSRVMGVAPDIETLTNLANPATANPTQGTDTRRPHLLLVNGKATADFDPGASQRLTATGASPALWAVGASHLHLFMTLRFDSQDNDIPIEFGDGAIRTGLRVYATGASGIRIGINAGGSNTSLNATATATGMVLLEAVYDGANIELFLDGVSKGTQAKTGTMTNACTDVAVGASAVAGQLFEGPVREAVLAVTSAVLTPAQVSEMRDYMNRSAGL